jgi:hypothetical protein
MVLVRGPQRAAHDEKFLPISIDVLFIIQNADEACKDTMYTCDGVGCPEKNEEEANKGCSLRLNRLQSLFNIIKSESIK